MSARLIAPTMGASVPLMVKDAGRKGRGVFARAGVRAFQEVVRCPVEHLQRFRTRDSIQIGHDMHADFQDPVGLINHACDPNCTLRLDWDPGHRFAAVVTARRDIAEGEELTWDYAQTESYSIAAPECLCGTASCRGRSMGFLELPAAERDRVARELGVADHFEGFSQTATATPAT